MKHEETLVIVTTAKGQDYLILQEATDLERIVQVKITKRQASALRQSGLLYGD